MESKALGLTRAATAQEFQQLSNLAAFTSASCYRDPAFYK